MKTKRKMTAIILLFSIIISQFSIMPISFAADREVSTVEKLQEEVNSAIEGDTITLASDFTFGDIELIMPDVNIIIDVNNKIWDSGSTTIKGDGAGSITIKNLKYNGASIDKKIININNENGKVILENVEITNSTKGAMDIKTGKDATTVLNKVHIYNNTAINTAPAIQLGENSNLDINNSTIENNTGTGNGEATGSISSKNYKGNLNIKNTVFRNNINNSKNNGTLGGGGGAMAFHYFYGNINITESIFDGNSTNGESGNIKDSYDGGAIYIFDGRANATFNIESSTFMNNTAYDDGGAIMFRGTGNPGLTTSITNSTFFKNKAYGLGDNDYAGGAIQYFKNGGSAKMVNNILSSTFVGNESGNENSKVEQRGGAIGLSGAGIFATAAVTRNNSLFLDNNIYKDGNINKASNYKDISNYTTMQEGQGKANVINVQRGEIPAYKTEDILGTETPALVDNQSNIKAGIEEEIIKTIPIKPESIADNGYEGKVEQKDQRDAPKYKDYGSVEISWIKYYANKGNFGKTETRNFIGEVDYYTNCVNNEIIYYTIGKIEGSTTIPNSEKINLTNEEKVFKGWSTNKDATEPDEKYSVGKEIDYVEENLELYAVWGEEQFKVVYDPNDGTGDIPKEEFYDNGTEVEVLPGENLEKENYKFIGWYTEKDGVKTTHEVGSKFVISEDATLYAQWEEVPKYILTYDGNCETSGSVIDETAYTSENNIVTVKENGFEKKNYSFKNWNTKADETGTSYKAEDTFTITIDTVLYAQWEENPYCKVEYNLNGGEENAPVDNEKYYIGDTVHITDEKDFIRENHIFINWNTEADGTGTSYNYWDEFVIGTNMLKENEKENTITLYAQWEKIPKFNLEYNGNKNTSGKAPVDKNSPYKKDTEIIFLDKGDLEKEGHEFLFWNSEADGSGTVYYPGGEQEITQDAKLYAIWKDSSIKTYIVNFLTNGGNNIIAEVLEKDNLLSRPENPKREGYEFVSWYTDKDLTLEFNFATAITENITLYAKWKKIENTNPTEPEVETGVENPSIPVEPDPKPIKPELELNKEDHYGYMVGYKDGMFRPNDNISRAEVTTLFFRILADNSRENYFIKTNNYSDVKNTAWYNNTVSTMSNGGLVNGYKDGTFRPNENMTRAELSVLITRLFDKFEKEDNEFGDIKNHWAEEEIAKISYKGWIEGYEDGTFKPDQPITRAETVKLINLILERTPDKNNLLDGMIEFKDNKDKTKWYYADIQEATNSHEFTRDNNKSKEVWTKLLPARDWSELDKRK